MKKIVFFLPSGLIIEKSGSATPNERLTRFLLIMCFCLVYLLKIELPDD
jgi:hypothetical protein